MTALAAAVGFYGKLPCRGDFLRRRVSQEFLDIWDEWLQASIAHSRQTLQDAWLDAYLTTPVWRFALAEGVCGTGAYAGVMVPSVDRVGRYFPLTIVAQWNTSESPVEAACGGHRWFDAAEALAMEAPDTSDFDAFDERVAQLAERIDTTGVGEAAGFQHALKNAEFPHRAGQWHVPLEAASSIQRAVNAIAARELERTLRPVSIWWTDGSDRMPAAWLTTRGLPIPESFGAMLTGDWAKTGWNTVGRGAKGGANKSAAPLASTSTRSSAYMEMGANVHSSFATDAGGREGSHAGSGSNGATGRNGDPAFGTRPGIGALVGANPDTDFDTRTGTGANPDAGFGARSSIGASSNTDFGTGAGRGTSSDIGFSTPTSAGGSPDTNSGARLGIGALVGANPDTGFDSRGGTGTSADTSFGARTGAGANPGSGFGTHTGIGALIGAGTDGRNGVGALAGTNADSPLGASAPAAADEFSIEFDDLPGQIIPNDVALDLLDEVRIELTAHHEPISRKWNAPPQSVFFVSRPDVGLWAISTSGSEDARHAAAQAVSDLLQSIPAAGTLSSMVEEVRRALHALRRQIARQGAGAIDPYDLARVIVFAARDGECALICSGEVQAVRCRALSAHFVIGVADFSGDATLPRIRELPASNAPNSLMDIVTGADEPALIVRYESLQPGDSWLLAAAPLFDQPQLSLLDEAMTKREHDTVSSLSAIRIACTPEYAKRDGPLPVLLLAASPSPVET